MYVVGGQGGESPAKPYSRVDIFDIEENTWVSGPALPDARVGSDPAGYGGDLLVCGGLEGDSRKPSASCSLLTVSGDIPEQLRDAVDAEAAAQKNRLGRGDVDATGEEAKQSALKEVEALVAVEDVQFERGSGSFELEYKVFFGAGEASGGWLGLADVAGVNVIGWGAETVPVKGRVSGTKNAPGTVYGNVVSVAEGALGVYMQVEPQQEYTVRLHFLEYSQSDASGRYFHVLVDR